MPNVQPYVLEARLKKLNELLAEAEATLRLDDLLFIDLARVEKAMATKAAVEYVLAEHERRVGVAAEAARRKQEEREEQRRRFLEALESDWDLRWEVKCRDDADEFAERIARAGGYTARQKQHGPLPGGFSDELRRTARRG
jgi:ribosomal protein L21